MMLKRISTRCPNLDLHLNSRFHFFKFFATCNELHDKDSNKNKLFPTSALHVSPRTPVISILKPDVNIRQYIHKIDKIRGNVMLRQKNLSFPSVAECTTLLKKQAELEKLQQKRNEVGVSMKEIAKKTADKNAIMKSSRAQKLMDLSKTIRKTMQNLSKEIWELEDEIIVKLLQLPNITHENTPLNEDEVSYVYGSKIEFDFEIRSHAELGLLHDCISFSDVSPNAYYLKNSVAVFEQDCQQMFANLLFSDNFCPLSAPDFFKPVVIEGCGLDFLNPSEVFLFKSTSENNIELCTSLHLTGSAHLAAFCAYHSRTIVKKSNLPLKYYSIGRCYQPSAEEESPVHGLFNTVQSSRVNFFVATSDDTAEVNKHYDQCVKFLQSIYEKFGLHFQIVNLSAKKLSQSDSLKTSFQVWSPFLKSYIEVGYVSLCNDYVSKRLICRYRKKREVDYMHMIHGVAVNIPHLIACIMENSQTFQRTFTIPTLTVDGSMMK